MPIVNPQILISGCAEEILDLLSRSELENFPAKIRWWPRAPIGSSLLRKYLPLAKQVENLTEHLDVICPPFPVQKTFPELCARERIESAIQLFPPAWITDTLRWEENLAAQHGQKLTSIHQLFAALYLAGAVQTLINEQPDLLLVWSGRRTRDAARVVVAKHSGVPVLFAERGPFPQSVFLADVPIGPEMRFAKSMELVARAEETEKQDALDTLIMRYLEHDQSAWKQPPREEEAALRKRWGIPGDDRIIFCAAQRPADANMLLHSPHFSSNGAFIRHIILAMRGLPKIALVVKPHPKEPTSSDQEIMDAVEMARQIGVMAVCDRTVNIKDGIDVSSVVASINSTTGLEALMHGVPVVVGGESYYSHQGFTFDVQRADDTAEIARLHDYIQTLQYSASQQDKFKRFFSDFCAKHLYLFQPVKGLSGADNFIADVAQVAIDQQQRRSTFNKAQGISPEVIDGSRVLLEEFSEFRLPRNPLGKFRRYLRRRIRKHHS